MSALAKLALGHLSREEQALQERGGVADPSEPLSPEMLESLLYQHLHVAAQARLRMDAARSWSSDYHADFTARERALEHAAKHYRALRELGPIDPLLARMATNEGLNP